MSAHRTRLIALVGLASFALIIVAVFVSPPLWSAPGELSLATHVATYLQANHRRSIASLYIYSLAMGLFLCFSLNFRRALPFAPRGRPPRRRSLASGPYGPCQAI